MAGIYVLFFTAQHWLQTSVCPLTCWLLWQAWWNRLILRIIGYHLGELDIVSCIALFWLYGFLGDFCTSLLGIFGKCPTYSFWSTVKACLTADAQMSLCIQCSLAIAHLPIVHLCFTSSEDAYSADFTQSIQQTWISPSAILHITVWNVKQYSWLC